MNQLPQSVPWYTDWRAWVVTVIVLLLIWAYVSTTQKSVESEGKKE